jgi:hypothetical protein
MDFNEIPQLDMDDMILSWKIFKLKFVELQWLRDNLLHVATPGSVPLLLWHLVIPVEL